MKVMDTGEYQTVTVSWTLIGSTQTYGRSRSLCNKHHVYFMFVQRLFDEEEIKVKPASLYSLFYCLLFYTKLCLKIILLK